MTKIGIIGAMELEVEELKSEMTVSSIFTRARMEFYEGSLNGANVVVVRSGIGKVNAGLVRIRSWWMYSRYPISLIPVWQAP